MSPAEWTLWITVGALGMIGSSMYSGLETGLYTINRVRLHLTADKSLNGRIIEKLINRPNRMLGMLLIGNNIANYMASYAIATILTAMGFGDWEQVGISALILTPLLFIFGEVLPKDLFANFTDKITYYFAKFLWLTTVILMISGLLPLVDYFSRGMARLLKSRETALSMLHPRRAVTVLIKEGLGQGVLSPYQSEIIDRVIHPDEPTVADAMIPWRDVVHFRETDTVGDLARVADRTPFARFPLVDAAGRPVSVVNVYTALMTEDDATPLSELGKPLLRLAPAHSRRDALVRMQREHVLVALVADDPADPQGIVTIKDLVEPIVGELDVW